MNERSPFVQAMAVLVTLVLAGWLLHVGRFLFLPLIVAWLLTALLRPLVTHLQRRGIPWGVTVGGLLIALLLLLAWLGNTIFESTRDFLATVEPAPSAQQEGQATPPKEPAADAAAPADFDQMLGDLRAFLDEVRRDPARLIDEARAFLPRATAFVVGGVGAIVAAFNAVLLVLFFMLLLFAEQSASRRKILAAAGGAKADVERVLAAINRDVNLYLVAKSSLALATALVAWAALKLLGVPYAEVFALLTFLLDYIPNVGSIVAALFPIGAAWIDTGGFVVPAVVAGVYLSINLVVGNLIEPRFLGDKLDLSPLVILLAVMFWSALWGLAGTFLAVPLTRTVQLVFANVPTLRPVAILLSNGGGLKEPGG